MVKTWWIRRWYSLYISVFTMLPNFRETSHEKFGVLQTYLDPIHNSSFSICILFLNSNSFIKVHRPPLYLHCFPAIICLIIRIPFAINRFKHSNLKMLSYIKKKLFSILYLCANILSWPLPPKPFLFKIPNFLVFHR